MDKDTCSCFKLATRIYRLVLIPAAFINNKKRSRGRAFGPPRELAAPFKRALATDCLLINRWQSHPALQNESSWLTEHVAACALAKSESDNSQQNELPYHQR